ncbi:MAG: DNA starvation/stationary phase protection protein Dps [Gemmatimonadales bacterium]
MIQKNPSGATSTAPARPRTATTPAGPSQIDRKAGTRLFDTKNDLPAATRAELADLLNRRLADCIDLQTQTKQAHWNVKGPSFIALHKLFDDINEEVEEYVDLLAERVVQLGGIAEGTARMVAGRSTLREYPAMLTGGEDHVDALSSALAAFGSVTRKAIDQADELEDADTMDILTEISRGVDKWLWFVEAHMQGEPEVTRR